VNILPHFNSVATLRG